MAQTISPIAKRAARDYFTRTETLGGRCLGNALDIVCEEPSALKLIRAQESAPIETIEVAKGGGVGKNEYGVRQYAVLGLNRNLQLAIQAERLAPLYHQYCLPQDNSTVFHPVVDCSGGLDVAGGGWNRFNKAQECALASSANALGETDIHAFYPTVQGMHVLDALSTVKLDARMTDEVSAAFDFGGGLPIGHVGSDMASRLVLFQTDCFCNELGALRFQDDFRVAGSDISDTARKVHQLEVHLNRRGLTLNSGKTYHYDGDLALLAARGLPAQGVPLLGYVENMVGIDAVVGEEVGDYSTSRFGRRSLLPRIDLHALFGDYYAPGKKKLGLQIQRVVIRRLMAIDDECLLKHLPDLVAAQPFLAGLVARAQVSDLGEKACFEVLKKLSGSPLGSNAYADIVDALRPEAASVAARHFLTRREHLIPASKAAVRRIARHVIEPNVQLTTIAKKLLTGGLNELDVACLADISTKYSSDVRGVVKILCEETTPLGGIVWEATQAAA